MKVIRLEVKTIKDYTSTIDLCRDIIDMDFADTDKISKVLGDIKDDLLPSEVIIKETVLNGDSAITIVKVRRL